MWFHIKACCGFRNDLSPKNLFFLCFQTMSPSCQRKRERDSLNEQATLCSGSADLARAHVRPSHPPASLSLLLINRSALTLNWHFLTSPSPSIPRSLQAWRFLKNPLGFKPWFHSILQSHAVGLVNTLSQPLARSYTVRSEGIRHPQGWWCLCLFWFIPPWEGMLEDDQRSWTGRGWDENMSFKKFLYCLEWPYNISLKKTQNPKINKHKKHIRESNSAVVNVDPIR